MTQWAIIREQISAIVANSNGLIDSATVENAIELLAFTEAHCGPPDQVGRGYWPTLIIFWSNFEFEVFPDRIESYRFREGRTDIYEYKRLPGMPFPEGLIADLTTMAAPA